MVCLISNAFNYKAFNLELVIDLKYYPADEVQMLDWRTAFSMVFSH